MIDGANIDNSFLLFFSHSCKDDDAFGDTEGIQDGRAEGQEAGRSGTSTPLPEGQQSMYDTLDRTQGFVVLYAFVLPWRAGG